MKIADSKRVYTTIKSKVETEKSYRNIENSSISFQVALGASKTDIKFSLAKLYPDLEVVSVRTLVRKGKLKRTRKGTTRKSDRKFAIVRFKDQVEKLSDLKVSIDGENNV